MLALLCNWLFWIVGAAILGFALAWLMKGAKVNEWRSQFEERDSSYKKLKGDHQGFVSRYDKLERSSNKLRNSNSTLKKDLSASETKTSTLMRKLAAVPAAAATAAVVSSGSDDNSYEIRAWESKYARLERELATKVEMFGELEDNNEMLTTKMEVLALTTEDAKKEKVAALGKLKQYEEYRPRFEEANLERNTLKYKYQELVAARSAVQTTQVETSNQTETLTSEITSLKAAIAAANEQTEAQKNKIDVLTSQNAAATNEQKEIKVKYDSLLGLQERTEVKMKTLEQQAATAKAAPVVPVQDNTKEIESYKSKLQAIEQENKTLKGSLEESKAQAAANDSTAEIANWADKHKAVSEENKQLKTSLEESKAATAAAQNAPVPTNEFEQKWNALKQEESAWTSKHSTLDAENKQLKTALEESKAATVAAQNAPVQTNEFEQKWNALKKEEAAWTAKHSTLDTENTQLQIALEKSKAATIAAQNAPVPTNEFEQKWNALKQEESAWTSKHSSLDAENKQLQAALEKSKAATIAAQNAPVPTNEFEQKWNALKQEEATWAAKHNALSKENEQLQDSLEETLTQQMTAKAPAVSNEFEQKWNALKQEESAWTTKHNTLDVENKQLKTALEESKVAAAKNAAPTVNEFEQKWNALKREESTWTSKHNTLDAENKQLKTALEESKAAKALLAAASIATPVSNEYEQKWNALKQEEANWNTQKQNFEAEIEQLKAAKPVSKTTSKAEKAAKAEAAKGLLASAIGTKIKVATEAEKDDLKMISGVGPFLETKLNNLGIYTFEQVGQFDTDLMQIVNDAIEFFPGRVQRDDWVGQAKKLHGEKNS